MKKVTVNDDACISCGACMDIAKNVFKFGPSGRSEVIKEVITDETDEKKALLAANSCPTNAITVEEAGETCQCENCECENCECEHEKN